MSGAGWWYRASTEQRLAQLDGGIECGMTANSIAVASGARVNALREFAQRTGRHFPGTSTDSPRGAAANLKRAYWGAENGFVNPRLMPLAKIDPSELPELVFE